MNLGHHAYDLRYGSLDPSQTHTFSDVNASFERHYFMIEFYKDEGMTERVSPDTLAGDVLIEVGVNQQKFTVDKGTITLGSAMYDIPTAMGSYDSYYIDVSGVTDFGEANYYKLLVNVYEG